MTTKRILRMCLFWAITLVLAYWAIFGAAIGLRDFKKWVPAIPQGLELAGGTSSVYEVTDAANHSAEDLAVKMDDAIRIMRARLDHSGLAVATIAKQGTSRIRVEMPNASNGDTVRKLLASPAKVQFKDPTGAVFMEGKDVASARPGYDQSGKWGLSIVLSATGRAALAKASADFLNQKLTVTLDGESIADVSVPTVIKDGKWQFAGDTLTEQSARDLAITLESGELPLAFSEKDVRVQSPTLGQDIAKKVLIAAAIGLGLVILIMIFFYRVPGAVSSVSMVLFVLYFIFMLATWPGVQLSLAGITGVILATGMAIHFNVTVFERMREEYAEGKSLASAINHGFSRALFAILDSGIIAFIAAGMLYWLGSGAIKGFALTLGLGTVVSMFTTLVVMRYLLRFTAEIKWLPESWFVKRNKEEQTV